MLNGEHYISKNMVTMLIYNGYDAMLLNILFSLRVCTIDFMFNQETMRIVIGKFTTYIERVVITFCS